MGERKVLTKYYPPDFDPSKLPRIKKPKDKENAVRFMLPMSVRCKTCGAFMGQGLKFNARKSNTNEDYLGIKIFRFYMRCKQCPATFAIKTDPKNGDYVCEEGVKRNYEPWRDKEAVEETAKAEREDADQDAMVALENKTLDAKSEMEELDALDELKTVKSVQARITPDQILAMKKKAETDADDQAADEAEARLFDEAAKAFAQKKAAFVPNTTAASQGAGLASIASGAGGIKNSAKSFPKPFCGVRFKLKKKPAINVLKKSEDNLNKPKDTVDTGKEVDNSSESKDAPATGMLDYSSSESEGSND